MDYVELESKIRSLQALPIEFKETLVSVDRVLSTDILRKAQIYNSQISLLEYKQEEQGLRELLRNEMIEKLRHYAPNFSYKMLNKMLCFMNRSFVKYPMDILAIDEAVFIKEAELHDFGYLYKYEIIMYTNDDYFRVFDGVDFTVSRDFVKEKLYEDKTVMEVFDFVSYMVNQALHSTYNCDVVEPLYKLNKNGTFYGYRGLVISPKFNGDNDIEIYFNKKANEIVDSLLNHEICDIKMVVQYGDKISYYIFHQSFLIDKPVWDIEKSDEKVWILSEAVGHELKPLKQEEQQNGEKK